MHTFVVGRYPRCDRWRGHCACPVGGTVFFGTAAISGYTSCRYLAAILVGVVHAIIVFRVWARENRCVDAYILFGRGVLH